MPPPAVAAPAGFAGAGGVVVAPAGAVAPGGAAAAAGGRARIDAAAAASEPAKCRRVRRGVDMGPPASGGRGKAPYPQRIVPPLTLRISPVMKVARWEHRNRTGPAISCGVATRPSGDVSPSTGVPSRA